MVTVIHRPARVVEAGKRRSVQMFLFMTIGPIHAIDPCNEGPHNAMKRTEACVLRQIGQLAEYYS